MNPPVRGVASYGTGPRRIRSTRSTRSAGRGPGKDRSLGVLERKVGRLGGKAEETDPVILSSNWFPKMFFFPTISNWFDGFTDLN